MHGPHIEAEREAAFINYLTQVKKAIHTERLTARDVEYQIRAVWYECWRVRGELERDNAEAA